MGGDATEPEAAVVANVTEGLSAEERKLAANRKKREKQKATQAKKKALEGESGGKPASDGRVPSPPARDAGVAKAMAELSLGAGRGAGGAAGGSLPPSADEAAAVGARLLRAVRADAGVGRGLGLFAREDIPEGETLALATPALSVVFDTHALSVCGFCFSCPPQRKETIEVTIRAAVVPNGADQSSPGFSFGLVLDDETSDAAAERAAAPSAAAFTVAVPAAVAAAAGVASAAKPGSAIAAVVKQVVVDATSAEAAAAAAAESAAAAEARR